MPISMWQGVVEATGDASGGVNSISHLLTSAGDLDDRLFSVEHINFQHDVVTALNVLARFQNMQRKGNPALPISITRGLPQITGLDGVNGYIGGESTFLPVFMGSPPAPALGLNMFVTLTIANTDTVAFRAMSWGYAWSARSLDTPTGPRRPQGSVFGN